MGTADGTILGATKIVDNGPATQRFNIVMLSDGYRSDQMSQFASDALNFANTLLSEAPYDRLGPAINVYRVDVASTDAGQDDPASCPAGPGPSPGPSLTPRSATMGSSGSSWSTTRPRSTSSTPRSPNGTWGWCSSTASSTAARAGRSPSSRWPPARTRSGSTRWATPRSGSPTNTNTSPTAGPKRGTTTSPAPSPPSRT